MKLFRNKLFVGLLCIIAGLAVVFLAVPAVVGQQEKTEVVYQAAEDIVAGTIIDANMLKKVDVPAALAPENKANPETSIGLKAISAIYKGDTITADKITANYVPADTYSIATEKGKMVMSISIKNLSVVAAARIQPGDVVTVLALPQARGAQSNSSGVDPQQEIGTGVQVEDQTGETEQQEQTEVVDTNPNPETENSYEETRSVIYPELKYLEVAAVVASKGNNAQVKEELGEKEENALPTTVSFYVTEEQALRLAELEKDGTAYVAFVARGKAALDFIPNGEKVLMLEDMEG